jgi:acyl-CoA hydrolase
MSAPMNFDQLGQIEVNLLETKTLTARIRPTLSVDNQKIWQAVSAEFVRHCRTNLPRFENPGL